MRQDFTCLKYVVCVYLSILLIGINSNHLQAQIGLVWANSDYGSESTMSSTYQEITLDIAQYDGYIFSLIGRSQTLDGDLEELFIYAHPVDGALTSNQIIKYAITDTLNRQIVFPMKGVTCNNGNSFTPPRKFHLEVYNGNIYIAGTLMGPMGAKFPKPPSTNSVAIPPTASNAPILFIAKFSTNTILDRGNSASGNALLAYNFIHPEYALSGDSETVAFVTDLDIDHSTGNPYIVGIYREKNACDATVQIEAPIDYTPVLGGTIIKDTNIDTTNYGTGPIVIRDPSLVQIQRPIEPNNNTPIAFNSILGNQLRANGAFRLAFSVGTNLNAESIVSYLPLQTAFSAGGYNFTSSDMQTSAPHGEINFWAAYNPDLTAFHIKPVPILGDTLIGAQKYNNSVAGTIIATSLTLDDNFVYIGGTFSRAKNHYPLKQELAKDRNYLIYYGAPYSVGYSYIYWSYLYDNTDTLFAPAIISKNPKIGVDTNVTPNYIKFAQNSFISKYENTTTARLVGEQKISGTATQSLQDVLVANNQLYALIQVYKTNAFDLEHNKVYFRTNKEYYSNSRGNEHTSFYDYKYTYGDTTGHGVDYFGTTIQNGLYLAHISNSAIIPTKEAKIEKYQKITTANQTIPYALSDNIKVDNQGNLFVAMVYSGNISIYQAARTRLDMDGEVLPTITPLTAVGRSDIAVIKFNSDMRYQWAQSIGGLQSEGLPSIIPDNNGGFYLGGAFQGLTDFEPAINKIYTLSSRGIHDAFVAKYGCPQIEIKMKNEQACVGTPVELFIDYPCLGGCNISYTWTNIATNANYPTSYNSHTFAPSVGTNVVAVLAVDNHTGCAVRDTFSINALPEIILNASPTNAYICEGQSVRLSASTNLNDITYAWYHGSNTTPLDTTNQYIATRPGVYRVEASYFGCKNSTSVLLNQYEIKSPRIVPDTARLCGSEIELEVKGCPGCSFNWSAPIGATQSSNTANIIANAFGTYVVTAIDNNGCSYILNKEVITSSYLLPSIEPRNHDNEYVTALCNNEPLILEAYPQCPTCIYQWSDGSTGKYAFAFTPNDYRVTVTNTSTGCTGTSNPLHITQNTLAKPVINAGPDKICIDNAARTMAYLYVNNACAGCEYTWYTNHLDTNYIVGVTSSLNMNVVGDYVVKVTDSNNCSDFSLVASVDSVLVGEPVITTNHELLCANTAINHNNSNTAKIETVPCNNCSYKWFIQSSDNVIRQIVGATNHFYETSDPGTFFVEVTYSNGCVRRSTTLVIGTQVFEVRLAKTAGISKYICDGEPVLLTLSGLYELPPNWDYQWYRNGLVIPNATGYSHNTTQEGFYFVKVTNENGCVAYTSIDTVKTASAGANPALIATPDRICENEESILTVSTNPCTTCLYGWRLDNNALETQTDVPSHTTSNKRGYYVAVYDTISRCTYLSNVVQIRDTSLAVPAIQALQDPYCRPLGVGVILSTPAQVGATYLWYRDNVLVDSSTQNTFVANITSTTYAVKVRKGDCISERSSFIPVSFKEHTPQLFSQGTPVICNGNDVILYVTPKDTRPNTPPTSITNACSNCRYRWYKDGVEVAGSITTNSTLNTSEPGDYYVVFTDGAGCQTTTNAITVYTSQSLARINSTTLKEDDTSSLIITDSIAYVCGATTPTTLTVADCSGCLYTWSFSPNSYNTVTPINRPNSSTFTVTGQASEGYYTVQVNNNGCISTDRIKLVGRAAFRDVVLTNPIHNNICNGSPVILTATGPSARRQWMLNGAFIAGVLAEQSSYSTSIPGNYSVVSVDSFGCIDTTAAIQLIESNPATGFAINFDVINPVPITTPILNLNAYLQPTSIHNGRGKYTSLTTINAFSATQNNLFDPSAAGAGHHIITYTDTVGSCMFKVSDTLEILQMTNVDIVNKHLTGALRASCQNTICPSYEACLQDSMQIVLTNFPFVPNIVQFYSNNGYIDVPVTPVVRAVGSVWSGTISVIVPNNSKTGKLRLTDGNQNYQTDFFLVVQNPTVNLNLQGVTQPLCSNNSNASLIAIPATGPTGEGLFSIAYSNTPTVNQPSLLVGGNAIDASQVAIDINTGRRDLIVKYSFNPYYTGTIIPCSNSIVDTMHVEVRNINIDSIEYTPISVTQIGENMNKLTRIVKPISARAYTHHYTATYVNNDSIRASTIPTIAPESVTYHISNSGCTNSVIDNVEIYPAPSLDSLHTHICRQTTDTIWIGRNTNGPFIRYGTAPAISFDAIYAYAQDGDTEPYQFTYTEEFNYMTITSSNGGLIPFNSIQGQELYALVPANISNTSTDISIVYRYKRDLQYFDALASSFPGGQVEYIIGSINKTIHFEDLLSVAINPTIMQDPVFCKVDEIVQFSGIPNGGQFYLDTTLLVDNLFNAINYTTDSILNNFQLKYVYEGRACRDSATTTLFIPRPFQVTLNTTRTDYCHEEGDIAIGVNTALPVNRLDANAGRFYVGSRPSGTIFSPSQLQPGSYPVYYYAYDIDGCEAVDSATFVVHETPALSMTTLANSYCTNSATIPIDIFAGVNTASLTNITSNFNGYIVTLQGNGLQNAGISMTNPSGVLAYNPSLATSGRHITDRDTIIYTIVNANTGCTNSMQQTLIVRELPILDIYRDGGEPLPASMCEGDSIRIVGTPIGGVFASVSVTPMSPSNLRLSTGDFVANVPDNNTISVDEYLLYTFQNNATGCRDTITATITVLNRATIEITGVPNTICAIDSIYNLGINAIAGPPVTSGYFYSSTPRAIQTGTMTATFNPSYTNLTNRPIRYAISYQYMSNGCAAQKDTTIVINPLPQLTFTTVGSRVSGLSDTRMHICESASEVVLLATNTYNGTTSNITTYGTTAPYLFRGNGVRFIGGQTNRYVYNAANFATGITTGVYPNNVDTISYTYRDINGCVNSISQEVVLDTIPILSWAGLHPNKLVSNNPDVYSYCGNDPGDLLRPNPFGGAVYFDGQIQGSGTFNFQPSDWTVIDSILRYELKYVYTAANYTNGAFCRDSLTTFIDIKPIPVLSFVSVPTSVCVGQGDSNIPLRALPVGGIFMDTTPDVLGGILSDTMFNIWASYGIRNIIYTYTDPLTTCTNTIAQNIPVYRKPIVDFASVGGCVGSDIVFETGSTGLSNILPSIDSITSYLWSFGDGTSLASTTITNASTIPDVQHVYNTSGIYFPTLTITNQGVCSNTGTVRTVISKLVSVTNLQPYKETFDSTGGWFQETIYPVGQDSLWHWGLAQGQVITTVDEENKVWVTRLQQPYNSKDRGWVLSPCFDISTLNRPMIALDTWIETRAGIDGAVIEYFRPDINQWVNLGERNKGLKWYNQEILASRPGEQLIAAGIPVGWSGDTLMDWVSSRYRLDTDTQNGDVLAYAKATNKPIRLRISFAASDYTESEGRKGFAFDNVYIGERTQAVLLEHLSDDSYEDIDSIETALYDIVYDNLYGKDLVLIQYPVGQDSNLDTDLLNVVNSRVYSYSDMDSDYKSLRINGRNHVPYTQYLVDNYNNEREYLDMEMLGDAKFQIKLPPARSIFQVPSGSNYGHMNAQVVITALQNIPELSGQEYHYAFAAITEDNVKNRRNHVTKSLLRQMVIDNTIQADRYIGTPLQRTSWAIGDTSHLNVSWDFNTMENVTNNLKLTVFIQRSDDYLQEVLQVATSRDLTLYYGPVPIEELPQAQGKEIIDINLYPNPAQSYFNVDFKKPLEGAYEWRVSDMLGRIVSSGKTQTGDEMIQVSTDEYSSGMYIFTILNDNVRVQRQVIIARP